MADSQEHFEFLFTAKDLASQVITTAQEHVEQSAVRVENALREMTTAAEKMTAALASGAVQARDHASALGGISDIIDTLGSVGSIFSKGLLAPFGMFGKLLSPIIDAFVETLMPAFETFGALLKNQLAPLGFLFETMAQQLAPMVNKLLTPMVGLLEIAAVHFASMLTKLFDMSKVGGGIAGTFHRLMPVALKLVDALVRLGMKLGPMVMDLLMQVAPLLVNIVELLGEQLVVVVTEFGKAWGEIGPELVQTFVDLLKAVLPLLPPLVRLATVLVKDVFGPGLVVGIKWFAKFMRTVVTPGIRMLVDLVVPFIDSVSTSVEEFFGDLESYAGKFKTLFIDPLAKWFGEIKAANADLIYGFGLLMEKIASIGKKVLYAFGLEDIGTKMSGVMKVITDAWKTPLETLKAFFNEFLLGPLNTLLSTPLMGKSLAERFGLNIKLPIEPLAFADGAVVPDKVDGGVPAIFGEAGPEVAMPLTKEGIEKVVEPILPRLEFPGLEDSVMWLERIHKTLTGTLRVQDVAGGGRPSPVAVERRRERDDLGSAVGLTGIMG